MISNLQQKALLAIAKNICEGVSSSGGDWDTRELFDDAVKKNQLSSEEASWLNAELIKRLSDYRG